MACEFRIRAYPKDLAAFVRDNWQTGGGENDPDAGSLPDFEVLKHLLSVCYQASLLRDEERPVRFRLIFRSPDGFPSDQGPPDGLHRLLFRTSLPFTERELRKLSPSVDFYGSLIGSWYDGKTGLIIWGIVHSGLRWAQSLHGGGKVFQPLPGSLVIHATNPGRITVSNGSNEIVTLNSGEIVSPSTGVFDSDWIRSGAASLGSEEYELHMRARRLADKPWAIVDPEFFRMIRKQIIMRIIGRIRSNRHGGTLLFIPDDRKEEFVSENPFVKFKYKFVDEEPSRRFRTLVADLANILAESCGSDEDPDRVVGWAEYLATENQALSRLNESVFEWAHMVAGMAQVDGAVAITRRFELVGFGAEISGKLDRLDTVALALDLEGTETRCDQADYVGTRHHSVYSLCNVLHDILAVVVSQDGTVQLVKWNRGMVTVWDQVSPSLIDA